MNTVFFKAFLTSAILFVISADLEIFPKEIIGGVEVQPHSIPFIVSLVYSSEAEKNVSFCTGSLLNEHWILTASQCLQLYPTIYVVAGQHTIEIRENTTQTRKATALYQHTFMLRDNTNCIGLIYVEQGFNLTNEVQPVVLGELSTAAGEKIMLQGWGGSLSSKVRIYPENLRSTNLSVVAFDQCKAANPNEFEEEINFCARGIERVTCVEQPGGPVLQNGLQVGIVPWRSEQCDEATELSMFMKVSACKGWIQEHVFKFSKLDVVNSASGATNADQDDLIFVNLSSVSL